MSAEDQSTVGFEHTEFVPADDYDGDYAILCATVGKRHVIDVASFDNSDRILNEDGSEYDGYSANIGGGETLCGHSLTGRMVPLDIESTIHENGVCGTCLRALETREVDPDD